MAIRLENYTLPGIPSRDSFSSMAPAEVGAMEGLDVTVELPAGESFRFAFRDGVAAVECVSEGWPSSVQGAYHAANVGKDEYLIAIDVAEPAGESITLFLRFSAGNAVVVRNHYVGDDTAQFMRGPDIAQDIRCGFIAGSSMEARSMERTDARLGGRDFLLFDRDTVKEFIYLNHSRIVEHYVFTPELCGKVERQHADDLLLEPERYLLCWREMDTQQSHVGVFDYKTGRLTATTAYMTSPWSSSIRLTGALIVPVNGRIDYWDGLEPTN